MTASTEMAMAVSFGPHAMCQHCWDFVTNMRPPHRLEQEFRQYETCCRCGDQTLAGIYGRHDGRQLFSCPGHQD